MAELLLGDAIFANVFLLGFAFQKGYIPLQGASIAKAIELNGVAVDRNLQALEWGRRAAVDPERVEREAAPTRNVVVAMPESLDKLIAKRVAFLTDYQNGAYARQYEDFVRMVQAAESRLGASDAIAKAVARNLFKLMAYKDEYEVARLYTNPSFMERLKDTFDGRLRLSFHLAPPALSALRSGQRPHKRRFGGWILPLFRMLARLRGLRGTSLDLFGRTAERQMERALIEEYRQLMARAAAKLSATNTRVVLDLACVPELIRGFGHVKHENVVKARARARELEVALQRNDAAPFEPVAASLRSGL